MPSTYTLNNGIELIGTGEQSGTWGDTTNTNLGLLDAALDGQVTITLGAAGSSGSPNALPITDGTTSNGRNRMVVFADGGDLGATAYVQLTPNDAEKIIYIRNSLSGSRSVILFQGTYNASNDYEVPAGTTAIVYFDGAGAGAVAANVFNNAYFDGLRLGSVSVTAILDEDNMASDSATALATQQSIKAYVDAQVDTVDTLAEILAIGNTTGATDIAVDSAQKVQFRDAAIYINSSVDGQLDIVADTEIQIAATTVDLNGALDVSGTALVTGVLTTTAATVSNGGGQFNGAINVGVDDTGYDVKFFGATTGKSLLWDESADSLIVTGTTTLVGTTNLDAVDIDGATQIDATVTVGVDDTGYDVKFFGATAGAYMLWDESADDLILGGAAGLSVNSTALVTGVLTTTAATVFNGGFASNANSTVGGTLGVTGVVTANAGVVVDNITIDGDTIALSSGTLVLDSAGQLVIDVDGGIVQFKDAGTEWAQLKSDSTNVQLISIVLDKDIIFRGNDGGVFINALTLDMSEGGAATFASTVTVPTNLFVGTSIVHQGDNNTSIDFQSDVMDLYSGGSLGIRIQPTAVTINEAGADYDFRVESDTNTHALFVEGSSGNVGIGTALPTQLLTISGVGATLAGTAAISLWDGNSGGSRRWAIANGASATGISQIGALTFSVGSGSYTADPLTAGIEVMRIDSSGGLITNPAAGGDAVFNEGGVNADFRVESDGNTHMLFVDASTNRIGMNDSAPASTLSIISDEAQLIIGGTTGGNARGLKISTDSTGYQSNDTVILDAQNAASGEFLIKTQSVERLSLSATEVVFNDTGIDTDFRVESDTNANMLTVDAGNNTLGIGKFGDGGGATSKGAYFNDSAGNFFHQVNTHTSTTSTHCLLYLNRQSSDGDLVEFRQADSAEGTISVSGSTVSYNGFSGRHESSGIPANTPVGTVVSTINELDVYPDNTTNIEGNIVPHKKAGQTRADHAKVEVSTSAGDPCVYGVVSEFNGDGKLIVTSVGVGSIRVTGACSKGDLLESNGDGTAKVQSDDIIRSKTIGKVTIGNSDTGVKLVACVMYCG
jgi:hypothetical protein